MDAIFRNLQCIAITVKLNVCPILAKVRMPSIYVECDARTVNVCSHVTFNPIFPFSNFGLLLFCIIE